MSDKQRSEREFQEGDWIYLKLQPYRQSFIALTRNLKLTAKYYGIFRVEQRVRKVAYKLQLLPSAAIHPVFHDPLLKKKLGEKIVPQLQLPIFKEDEVLVAPDQVLDTRTISRVGQLISQALIKWANLPIEDATWEDQAFMATQFP